MNENDFEKRIKLCLQSVSDHREERGEERGVEEKNGEENMERSRKRERRGRQTEVVVRSSSFF